MESLMKSDIFFFVATIATVVVAAFFGRRYILPRQISQES